MASATVPEQIIAHLLKLGVGVINQNIDLLDPILAEMSDHDKTSIKNYWTSNPPNVLSGYARAEGPFPCIAIVLQAEQSVQDYMGMGEEIELMDNVNAIDDHFVYKRRISGSYALHIMAEHPDVCLANYRVARRILSVGYKWLMQRELYDITLVGQELGPDTRYSPEHLFIRKLIVTLEYEEEWRGASSGDEFNDELADLLDLDEPRVPIPHAPESPAKHYAPIVHEDGGNGPAEDSPDVYPGWHPINPDGGGENE